MLTGIYSVRVLVDLLLKMERHIMHDAGMLVGAMMLSLIFQVCSGVTLFGSFVEAKVIQLKTNEFGPLLSLAKKHGIIDSAEMWCSGEVHSDTLLNV